MPILRLLPRFQKAYREMVGMEAREKWSRAEIERYQLERLNIMWSQAQSQVPYYQNLQAEKSLPKTFESLQEFASTFPFLEKQSLKRQPNAFVSSKREAGRWHSTGGSTGSPTRVFWSTEAYRTNLRTRYRCQKMWGVDFLEPQAMLWGHAASFGAGWVGKRARLIQPWIDWFRRRVRLSAYRLGPNDLSQYLQRINHHQATMLYGYSAAVLQLARRAIDLKIVCPSLKLCILTGEPAFDWLKAEVECGLGVPAATEYGSVECGVMANEWPDRTLRVREDVVLLETVPRKDDCFDVVVTVLTNPSFPLFRYKVGDICKLPLHKPEVGFASLSEIIGRQNDLLRSSQGGLVHAMSLKHVFEQMGRIQRFRAHQDSTGKLTVLLEVQPGDSGFDLTLAKRQLAELLEDYPVEIKEVEEFPESPAGKHRWVTSDLVAS